MPPAQRQQRREIFEVDTAVQVLPYVVVDSAELPPGKSAATPFRAPTGTHRNLFYLTGTCVSIRHCVESIQNRPPAAIMDLH